MKKILTATIVLLGLCISSAIVYAEPVVEDVTIEPAEPEVLGTVTITATITSEDEITEVTMKIHECDPTMCMPTETYEMDYVNGEYTATHDLSYNKATYFGYSFIITSNGNETETDFENVTLKPAENGGDNGGNGGDGDGNGGIPGFELVPLFRRKRSR